MIKFAIIKSNLANAVTKTINENGGVSIPSSILDGRPVFFGD